MCIASSHIICVHVFSRKCVCASAVRRALHLLWFTFSRTQQMNGHMHATQIHLTLLTAYGRTSINDRTMLWAIRFCDTSSQNIDFVYAINACPLFQERSRTLRCRDLIASNESLKPRFDFCASPLVGSIQSPLLQKLSGKFCTMKVELLVRGWSNMKWARHVSE